MQLQTTGKVLHVGPISNVLRQGENNADAPVITLPASYNGLDLAGLTFVIYADSEVGTRASQTLQKQISGTTIELTWQITSDFTSIPGKLDIILKGYNTENQVVIKWIGDYPIKVTADEGELSAENPPPEYTQALNEMYEILEQTQAIAQYPPLIGENDNWMLYDANAQGYIDSQKPSRGDTGPKGDPGPQGPKGDPGLGLPTPTVVDVGKVPMVNPMGDGYELGEVATNVYTKAESDARYAPIAAAIRPTVTGETISVNDSVEWPLQGLTVYGKSTQDGTPTPEAPIPIVSAGNSGTITVTVSDGAEQSQTLPVSTPNGLPGIPVTSGGNYTDADGQQWVCDEIDFERGKYVQRFKMLEFDGTEGWRQQGTTNAKIRFALPVENLKAPPYNSSLANIVSTHYPTITGDQVHEGNQGISVTTSPWISIFDEIYGNKPGGEALSDWKSYLAAQKAAGTPVKVVYELETPVETNIPEETIEAYKSMKTYAPVTNITTDSTPSAGLSVRYVADAQKYIDNKLSTINAQLFGGKNKCMM